MRNNNLALLVVDAQVDVVRGAWEAPRVLANMALAVERARAQGVPVLWVQHDEDDLVRHSAGWQWAPELVPAVGEARIYKQFNSAFAQTELAQMLERLAVKHIVLAGCATNWCIRATAYAALERGYDLTLLSDAHTTKTQQLQSGATLDAAVLVHDLNNTMAWLRYPGRRNAAVPVREMQF